MTAVSGSDGSYTDYRADVRVPYLAWLDDGDQALFHEYGHAWSLYYAYMDAAEHELRRPTSRRAASRATRGSDTLARLGRPRADRRGLPPALRDAERASEAQENRDLPAAADVPGLRDFLSTTFMHGRRRRRRPRRPRRRPRPRRPRRPRSRSRRLAMSPAPGQGGGHRRLRPLGAGAR